MLTSIAACAARFALLCLASLASVMPATPAAAQSDTPKIRAETMIDGRGGRRVIVDLRFLCSPHLYWGSWNGEGGFARAQEMNRRFCEETVAKQVEVAQQAFNDSYLPIVFRYSVEDLPGLIPLSSFGPVSARSEADPNLYNRDVVPDGRLKAFGYGNRFVIPVTCNPFLFAGAPPQGCGDPASTVVAGDGGGAFSSLCTFFPTNTVGGTACPIFGRPVRFPCQCRYVPGGGSTSCISAEFEPGCGREVISQNSCGCAVQRPISDKPLDFEAGSFESVFGFLDGRGYMPPIGRLQATVVVRKFSENRDPRLYERSPSGMIYRLYLRENAIIVANGETLIRDTTVTPETYPRTVGLIAVTMASGPETLAHELGHFFGALHERRSYEGTPLWDAAKLADPFRRNFADSGYRNIGHQYINGELKPVSVQFRTLMANPAGPNRINVFSYADDSYRIYDKLITVSDGMADNRGYIVSQLTWLTGFDQPVLPASFDLLQKAMRVPRLTSGSEPPNTPAPRPTPTPGLPAQ